MARIRSVKPELWSDAKISALSHGCIAFFIGLWNFCDDEGKCENDARQLSLRMPVFRSKDILTWIRALSDTGLVQVSEDSQWLLVTNWHHQKIDKPRLPKVKSSEIQWLPVGHSSKPRDSSSNVRRKDRIGEDRKGSGSDKVPATAKAAAVPKNDIVLNAEIWKAYSEAYLERYKTTPVRNLTVNSQVSKFAKRLGAEAPAVIRFYLSHTKAYYISVTHSFGAALHDAEALRTQWATGRTVSQRDAQQADNAQTLAAQMKKYGAVK